MAHRGERLKFWLRVLAPVLASIAGLATLRLLGPDIVSRDTLQEFLAPMGIYAPIGFILLLAVRPLTLMPGQLFTAVGGILFGMGRASIYALVGSFLSGTLVFWLSRKFGTRFMKRFAGDKYAALEHTARRHDFKMVALMTINPLVPTDVLIAFAAASGARFWPTVAGMMVGTLPGTILTAQFGSALGAGKTIMTILSAAGLIISMVLGVFVGRKMVLDFGDARRKLKEKDSGPEGGGARARLRRHKKSAAAAH